MDAKIGKSILILEDEAIIAWDLLQTVEDAGFSPATVMSSCAKTLAWLDLNTPNIAILDIGLKDGTCSEVARVLVDRHVPFVVCSASLEKDVETIFHGGLWIPKPWDPNELVRALRDISSAPAELPSFFLG
jgi:DNA-binding response OmpR family regulator